MNSNYKIKCIVTGQELGRSPKYLEKQYQKYGFTSIDAFRDQYIGRVARKLLKAGRTVDSIRQEFNCDITTSVTEETLVRYQLQKPVSTGLRNQQKPTLRVAA